MTAETGSERFHRHLYLSIQRLRGRPLARYIRRLEEWERLDRQAFQRLRAERLKTTLEYARTRVPLYRGGEWHRAHQNGNPGDLRSWPVLERETVQARGADLLARPTTGALYYRTTSGSTGKPLRIGTDPDGAAWAWANDYRGLLWHGIRPGARSLTLRPSTESRLAEWIRNRRAIPATEMSFNQLSDAVRCLQSGRVTYVWGYTSAVVELARHARLMAGPGRHQLVPFVKLFGEMVHSFQRRAIEEGLGARVIETYGCNETGTVAYQCPTGSLHIFAEHVEVEILKDGEPVPPGETGDIVLTCTTNKVMPLIRYRVEDRGQISPEPCSCGRPHPVIAAIEGRVGEVLMTASGVRVHGTAALGTVLKNALAGAPATAVGQVLFEQHTPCRWTVLVQAGPEYNQHIGDALIAGVRATFGEECRVTVRPVDAIPRQPSGKFRFYRAALEDTV